MAVEVHVDGVVQRGRFAEFLTAAQGWQRFRQERGWCAPRLLCGLSGTMNTVRFVFRYDSLADYEREEQLVARDVEYARIASAMPFDGALHFQLFREEPAPAGTVPSRSSGRRVGSPRGR